MFRVYAIRYAHRDALRREHFYGSVERPDERMPISYFVWLIVGADGAVLVDTGFTEELPPRRAARSLRLAAVRQARLVCRRSLSASLEPGAG